MAMSGIATWHGVWQKERGTATRGTRPPAAEPPAAKLKAGYLSRYMANDETVGQGISLKSINQTRVHTFDFSPESITIGA